MSKKPPPSPPTVQQTLENNQRADFEQPGIWFETVVTSKNLLITN